MDRLFLCLLIWLLVGTVSEAKYLLTPTDSIMPDYNQAVDLCLVHRFTEAENLLKQIIRNTDHPNRKSARFLLLEDVYFRRNQYQAYVHFCDSTAQNGFNTDLARFLAGQPTPKFILSTDSIQIQLRVKKWPIVNVLVNGKPYRFILDTGCERTIVSRRLAKDLRLPHLFDTSFRNILNQTIPTVLSRVDTLRIGGLVITNLPVWQTSVTGFRVDGLLGWDVLQKFTFTIDYATQQLTLRKPIVQLGSSCNLLGIGRPLLVFQASTGNQLNIFLDTGSDYGVSLTPAGLTKIGNYKSGHRLGLQAGLGGHFRIGWERMVKRITIRDNSRSFLLKKALVEYSNEIICSILKDGSVGSKQFRKGRLTIDYQNNHFSYCE